jgi:hypothetical protein
MTCCAGLGCCSSTATSPRAEPKRLRYCLLHTAGLIAHTALRVHLRLAADWPWATQLVAAFERVRLLRLQT